VSHRHDSRSGPGGPGSAGGLGGPNGPGGSGDTNNAGAGGTTRAIGDGEPPPFLRRWSRLYWLVGSLLALEIIALGALTWWAR
jgi:hypothetical protein